MTNRQNSNNQVATLAPARMKMPSAAVERYNLNDDSWRALVDGIFPHAKTVGAVLLALAYCEKNRLDIFQKPVHIVPMRVGNREVETVWPGIAQVRITAQRQPEFAGYDDVEFGPDIERVFKGKKQKWREKQGGGWERSGFEDIEFTLTFPEWAQFIVYKMIHGQRVRLPGPKVWFMETFAGTGEGGEVPNDMWRRRPRGQLEKCAEAAGYRRAFPDVLGNEMTAEEMEGRRFDADGAIEGEFVEVQREEPAQDTAEKKRAPRRADYQDRDQDPAKDQPFPEDREQRAQEGERVQSDQVRARDPEPSAEAQRRDRLLDGDGIPEGDQWEEFRKLLAARLLGFTSQQEVDEEQERQQFRIDAAPTMAMKQALYAMFDDTASEIAAANTAAKKRKESQEDAPEQGGASQQEEGK